MRGGRKLSLDDWFVAVSSGQDFIKRWFRLARAGVGMGRPYLAKVRPKHHAFQHMIDFLQVSEFSTLQYVASVFIIQRRTM